MKEPRHDMDDQPTLWHALLGVILLGLTAWAIHQLSFDWGYTRGFFLGIPYR